MADTSQADADYHRTAEIFGRTFGYKATPLDMNGLPGWAVRDEYGVLSCWFLSREYACRWIDMQIGAMQ